MLKDENSFFAQLFNSTQSLVALFKPNEQKFVQVNRFGLKMFELENMNDFISFFQSGNHPPNGSFGIAENLAEIEFVVNTQGFLEREMLYLTASGKSFWGLLRIDILTISSEKHFLLKITNIDALKNAEFKAIRHAQQLQAMFTNSAIGMVITNQEGEITNFNEFAEKQFGYTREEIIGKPVEVLIPHSFHHGHKAHRDFFSQQPKNRVIGAGRDLYAINKEGKEFPVEISLNHYRSEEKNYVIAFVIDISIRKRSEALVLKQKEELEKVSAQIMQMNAELEKKVEDRTKMLKETLVELEISKDELNTALEKEKELGELKSRFVTMASHEFRTPLSTILSSAYIVQQYTSVEDQEKRDRHLVKIQQAVQNLTFILEDFLSLEKLDKGLVKVNPELISEPELTAEIEDIIEEMEHLLKNGQHFQFIRTMLISIVTDKKLLRNILINLFSNAIKYSPEHSVITVECTIKNKYLKISVSDQGIGIPEADQKHLYERFFRAKNAGTIQGTGLGLNIVMSYLKLINAGMVMESEVNKGTTFTVSIHTEA